MERTHEVRSTGTKIARAMIWIFLLLVALITIFPVLYVVFGSFKENKELLVGDSNIFPSVWIIQNYIDAWQQANFARYTMNSLFISLGVMVLSLLNANHGRLCLFPEKEQVQEHPVQPVRRLHVHQRGLRCPATAL